MDAAIRKANHILKHADRYIFDPLYKAMVDSTVYLTWEQLEESYYEVARIFEN